MSERARVVLARLLERHGSWALVSATLGERVEVLCAVFAGADVPPTLQQKLLDLADEPEPPTPRGTRRP